MIRDVLERQRYDGLPASRPPRCPAARAAPLEVLSRTQRRCERAGRRDRVVDGHPRAGAGGLLSGE